MLIRREGTDDVVTVQTVIAGAFGPKAGAEQRAGAEVPEAWLAAELRAGETWLPALCLVAEDDDGVVIGQVTCSRGRVEQVPVVGLGPISVRPDRQRAGIGSALVHTALGAADALGEPLVALLGSPAYYRRFGFRPSDEYGIVAPDPAWGAHFQVRALSAFTSSTRGRFHYPEPFDRL